MTTEKSKFWHWPDHVIGKRESRRLRDEHNDIANHNAELTDILRDVLRYLVTPAGLPDKGNRTTEQQLTLDKALGVISKP